MEMELILSVIIIAFVMEFIDAFAGMGFGIASPILIVMGYHPLEVVFAVLFNSAALSITAGIFHHKFKNVDFSYQSESFRIASVLTLCGLISVGMGVLIAVELPENILSAYIGGMFLLVGLALLIMRKKTFKFSWKKIIVIGSFASFNKGITGGGFGPVLTSLQIMSGVDTKKAVGISSMTEGIISSAGVVFYLLLIGLHFNLSLLISLLIGGIMATPLSAYAVQKIHPKKLKLTIAIISIALGILTILKLIVG